MPVTHFLAHFPHFKAEKRGFCEEKMQFFKLQAVLSGGASARSTHFRFSAAFLGHFFMFPTCWAKRLAGLFVCLPFPLLLGWGCQALKQGAQLPGGGGVLSLEGVAVNAEGVHALGVAHQALHLPGGQFFDLRANPPRPGCSRPTQARAPGWGRFTR